MLIRLWTDFIKRKNSTKRPSTSAADVVEMHVAFKEDTSLENPVFIIDEPYPQYTYVQAFSDYYFVTDIVNLDNYRSEIHCTMDVLATFKTDILNYTAFVERAESEFEPFVIDPYLTAKQQITHIDKGLTSMNFLSGSGFVTQVLARNRGVVLYATPDLTPFRRLLIPSVYDASDITDWIDSKVAQAFDLDVYIGSVKWLPINPNHIGEGPMGTFYVGPIDVGVPTDYPIYIADQQTDRRHTLYNLTIPTDHKFNDFRDCHPSFSRYKIRLPGIGLVELDPIVMGSIINDSGKRLDMQMEIDYVTGDIVYYMMEASGQNYGIQTPFARFNGNISVNVPIAKSSADLNKTIGTFTSSVAAGAQAGGAYGAIAGAVVGAVGAIKNEMTPETSMVGSGSGNKSDINLSTGNIMIVVEHYGNTQYPTYHAGRPLYSRKTLSTLTGYVKCGAASVPLNARDSERDQVNNYLNSGFYIE